MRTGGPATRVHVGEQSRAAACYCDLALVDAALRPITRHFLAIAAAGGQKGQAHFSACKNRPKMTSPWSSGDALGALSWLCCLVNRPLLELALPLPDGAPGRLVSRSWQPRRGGSRAWTSR